MEAASESADAPLRWRLAGSGLVLAVLTVRVLYLAVAPLDLSADEAYYWDWSRQLDWGYYSKPPMIAWLIAASTRLGGDSALVVRLPAALLASLGLIWIYLLGERMFGPRTGFWAAAISAATPGAALMGLCMTIDAPLTFFWSAALYFAWTLLEDARATREGLEKETPSALGFGTRAGLLALLLGLGMLSKQTMLAMPLLGGLFVLVSARDRGTLREPWLWITPIAGSLMLVPTLLWNSQHGWITFQHTRGHFGEQHLAWTERLASGGDFLGGQMAGASPIFAALTFLVLGACLLGVGRLDRRALFLWILGGLPLLGMFALSFAQRVQPNWPAPFWVPATLLVAAWLTGAIELPRLPQPAAWAPPAVAGAALALAVGLYVAPWVIEFGGMAGTRLDPLTRLRGWSNLGEQVQRVAQREGLAPRHVIGLRRSTASQLGFYLSTHPRGLVWSSGEHVQSQYDLWAWPRDLEEAFVAVREDETLEPGLRDAFVHWRALPGVEISHGGQRTRRYALYQVRGFRGFDALPPLARRATSNLR